MKKIFIVFPVILSLILPFVRPVRSAAETFSEDGYLYCHRTSSPSYISMFFDDSNGYQNTLYWDDPYVDPSSFTISELSDSLWIYTPSSTSIDFDLGTYLHPTSYSDVSFSSDIVRNITAIEIVDSGTVNFYAYQGGTSHNHASTPCYTLTVSDDNVHGITSSIFDFAGFDDSLHVDVVFNPPLTGDVDRSVTSSAAHLNLPEGESAPPGFYDESTFISESFDMYVTNNSSTAVQVFFAIVPKDEHISFATVGDSDNDLVGCTYDYSVPVYVWWSPLWNYMFDQTQATSGQAIEHYYTYTSSKNYSPCPWHYLAAGSSFSQKFNWSEMDLNKNSQYDVLVYAVACPYDVPSRQCLFPSDENYIDLSSAELVYTSTFRAVNPVAFDPQSGGNHILWHNNAGYVDSAWTSLGHLDDNGNTVIESRDINHFNRARSDLTGEAWDAVHDSYEFTISSNKEKANFSNLLSQSKNYFSFVVAVFNFFPSYVNLAFCFGFWSLIFFAFIRRL